MTSTLRNLLWIVVWAGALWGSLEISRIHTSWDHALCGPWGCGPTATALVSCHMAWFIVLLPVGFAGNRWLSGQRRRQLGLALGALAAAIIVGVIAREATTWLPAASDYQRPYFFQRCAFVVGTWIDFPIVQLGLLGAVWWVAARSLQHSLEPCPAECRTRSCDEPYATRTAPQTQRMP